MAATTTFGQAVPLFTVLLPFERLHWRVQRNCRSDRYGENWRFGGCAAAVRWARHVWCVHFRFVLTCVSRIDFLLSAVRSLLRGLFGGGSFHVLVTAWRA